MSLLRIRRANAIIVAMRSSYVACACALAACRFVIPLPDKLPVVPDGPVQLGLSGHQPLAHEEITGAFAGDRYVWFDAFGTRRTIALVKNDQPDPFGTNGGYLREATYLMPDGSERLTRGTGESGWNGFGYVVNHFRGQSDNSRSKLGATRVVFAGRHHAIHEFKVQMQPGGAVDTTIHWLVATGKSHPIYSITFDSSPAGDNVVLADARAPYGDYAFEGVAAGTGALSGLGWGDRYLFRTVSGAPVSMQTRWDYALANRVPHVLEWSEPNDAEMGIVQTQTFEAHPAGGDYGGISACVKLTSDSRDSACSDPGEVMPARWLWPFQLTQYTFDSPVSRRIAWGMSYGSVGRSFVTTFGQPHSGYPFQSYAMQIVLDAHTRDPVNAAVVDTERIADSKLRAILGRVPTTGLGGVAREDEVNLTPAGYNHVYGTWLFAMENGVAEVNLTLATGELSNPVFQLSGYTKTTPPSSVTWQGQALAADRDYFASVDPATQTLWLTINGTFSGQNTLHVE
ncbi:MAG: hypothetical protein IT381_12055 [Deltaproteobacteria bacterium]|nr:hypothetical protein [Deltaproteobacteria bacterium]